MRHLLLSFAAAATVLGVPGAQAHDAGLSMATLQVRDASWVARLTFALRDAEQLVALDANGDGQVTSEEFAGAQRNLGRRVAAEFGVSADGKVLNPDATIHCRQDGNDNVEVELGFPSVPAASLVVESRLLGSLAPGHRQLLSVRDAGDNSLGQRLLHAQDCSMAVVLERSKDVASPFLTRWAPAFTLAMALAAGCWFAQRIWG